MTATTIEKEFYRPGLDAEGGFYKRPDEVCECPEVPTEPEEDPEGLQARTMSLEDEVIEEPVAKTAKTSKTAKK